MAFLSFEAFQTQWLQTAKAYLKEMRLALDDPDAHGDIRGLVRRCHAFYNSYADMKIKAVTEDASYVAACCGCSPLEISFLWMGGWRPTMSAIMVFSLMGMHFEDDLAKILEGIDVPTMAALSGHQLERLNTLQIQTRIAEDELSHQLALLQMSMCDLYVAKATSEEPPPSESDDFTEFREAMKPKLEVLRDIVLDAERLRSNTMEELIAILTPLQAIQYGVAAMELTLAVRKLGIAALLCQSVKEISSKDNSTGILKALQRGDDQFDGRTALHFAASTGYFDCVKMLVKCGANVNQQDNFGMTPLLEALESGHEDVAKFLEMNGGQISRKSEAAKLQKDVYNGVADAKAFNGPSASHLDGYVSDWLILRRK